MNTDTDMNDTMAQPKDKKAAEHKKGSNTTSSVAGLGTSRVYAIASYGNERRELREKFEPSVIYDYVFGKLPEDHEFTTELAKIETRYENRCHAIDVKGQRIVESEKR